jgi:TonB family protein
VVLELVCHKIRFSSPGKRRNRLLGFYEPHRRFADKAGTDNAFSVESPHMSRIRLRGLELGILASFVLPSQAQAQQPSPSATAIAYPNNAGGLRQLLNNMLFTAKREDPSELQSMIREMEIPNYQTWFTSNFGQERGESWGEPYGRWLTKNEKEFQDFFARLAQMEGELVIQSLDSAKTWDSLNGPLDLYRAKWHLLGAPKDEHIIDVGDFYFVEGKFRWFTGAWYDPFQKPAKHSVVPARLIKRIAPIYPTEARDKKIEGTVKLQVTVHKDGSVTVQSVLHGDAPLSQAAVDAVRQWRFEPFQLDGQSVDVQQTVEFVFSLAN